MRDKIEEEELTVSRYCRNKTYVYELCVIREAGWIIATVWIDSEDLFKLPPSIADKVVKGIEYGTLPIKDIYGSKYDVPCCYIDVD